MTVAIIGILAGLLLPAVQKAREAANGARCRNHLRQIGLALHQYHNDFSAFPPGVATGPGEPMPYLSWSVRIAPYLEQEEYWTTAVAAYQVTPAFWNGPPHPRDRPVAIFFCPSDPRRQRPAEGYAALTSYLGVSGTNFSRNDGCLYLNSATRLEDVTDGSSHTLIVGERPASADLLYGWVYAGTGFAADGSADCVLGVRETISMAQCGAVFARYRPGRIESQCDMFHYWSLHPGGANFAIADGSVRFIPYSAVRLMPALGTRAGGEAAEVP